jgi:DnaK suppressor protein
MQKALLEKYKRKLIDLEDRLDGEVHRLVDAIPDEVNSPGELSNVPTHNADRDVELFEADVELLRNEQDVHSKVHEALARIEAGTYGICERCGRPIPKARLDAIPYATHCKECAEILEKEEGPINAE